MKIKSILLMISIQKSLILLLSIIIIMQGKDQAKDRTSTTIRMSEDKGVLTIQTDDLALQIFFPSPILEVCNYL
jgi:hypothetical protein